MCCLRVCLMWLTRNHIIREIWGKFTSFNFWSFEILKFQKSEFGKFIPNFPLKHVITSTNNISSCYRTVPSAIWKIPSKFLTFCCLFHEPLSERNNRKLWETRNIFANIARGNCNNCFIVRYLLKWNVARVTLPYLLVVNNYLLK